MRIVYSNRSSRDLSAIESYTVRKWDARQAQRYVLKIRAVLTDIIAGVERGRPAELPLRPNLRRVLCGKHFVFFEVEPEILYVSRVLHSAMEFRKKIFPVWRNDPRNR